MSNARNDRRANTPVPQEQAMAYLGKSPNPNASGDPGGLLSGPLAVQPALIADPGAGGWGVGMPGQKPATGYNPAVNPWLIPKGSGLSVISQTYPSNYFIDWNPSSWRIACDRVMKQGWTPDYATLVNWVVECSPFVQSLFRTIESAICGIPFYYTDERGNVLQDWTEELCNKPWQIELRREMAFSFFWGFSGINFDPVNEKLYVYPMQDLDPLNRFLRQSTFAFYDGVFFSDHDNLIWCQPNTTYPFFLGWMQPIARQFIMMNLNDENWVQAGKRLAFPVFTIGYPEGSDAIDPKGNTYNPYKDEAYQIAKDIGPGKTVVFPYVRKADGEINKNIEVEFESPGSNAKAHSIYADFNEQKKNEIRELVMGGTLTADVGDSGSRALGEVQERKLRAFLAPVIEWVIAQHNAEYKKKIRRYYKNMPKGRFDINRAVKLTIEEIVAWSTVLIAGGKRFSDKFYEEQGLPPDFIEDNPNAAPKGGQMGVNKRDDGRVQELSAIQDLHNTITALRGLRRWR